MIYPLVNSIIYSFSVVTITGTGIVIDFQGLVNFQNIFKIEEGFTYIEALFSFLIDLVLQVPVIVVFSILIAILLNQPIKGRGVFRSIFFLPVIVSSGPVINELISQGASSSVIFESYGFISIIENSLSPWLAEPLINLFSEIIFIFWFSGVQILIFLAGLQKIDVQIYESARVDGAGPWQSFWKITIPSLKNLILVNTIYTLVLLATFSENEVILAIKSNMFNVKTGYGMASAMAWIYALIILFIIGLVFVVFMPKGKGEEGSLWLVKLIKMKNNKLKGSL